MKKVNSFMNNMHARMTCGWQEFKESQRGDTNFVSMILIIAVCVVLAGAFMAFGETAITTIQKKSLTI